MTTTRCTVLLLLALCVAQLAVVTQATRPGPMLRGGTVLLLSRPQSGGVFMLPQFAVESNALEQHDGDDLDRMLGGPFTFGPQMLTFGRPDALFQRVGPQRRPCPFGHHGLRDPDAMLKHMAAARFGPDLLSSLLASAEAEERRESLDSPVYTIDPASTVRASVEPRRLGGMDYDKEGPFRGLGPTLDQAVSAGGADPQGWEQPQQGRQQQGFVTTLSSGFGVSDAAAARLTPDAVARIESHHGMQLSLDRMQLGASRSFPMVTISSGDSDALEAAAAEVHALTDEPLQAAQHTMPSSGARWGFRNFVSRVAPGTEGHARVAALPQPDARQRAAFEGRLFGDTARAMLPPGHIQPPTPTWDLVQDDGQVNNGALVFLFLCIACVVVWSRLLVLWCGFRHGGRRGRRCRWRRCRSGLAPSGDAVQDSLEAPLLNPLQHEAPLPNTQPFKVEVAAKHTPKASFNNYVTLEYVPLRSEQ